MIAKGKVVKLAYSLKNSKGETIDVADSKDPFLYLHGAKEVVPGLEKALEGMKKGDKKSVTVAPKDGYGEINPELKIEVTRSQFPQNVELKSGMQFETHTQDGYGMIFTVESVTCEKVLINGNHPLAGETLHFEVEVLEIRAATQEEADHGHAHDGTHNH